jgi:hypothetical protein
MTLKVIIPYDSMSTEMAVGGLKKRKVDFPYRCVFCGGQAESFATVDMSSADIKDLYKPGLFTLYLPYCSKDAELHEKYKKQYEIVIGILFFLVILISVAGWAIADQPAESFLVLAALVAAGIFLVNKILLMVVPRFKKIPTFNQRGALGVIIKEIPYKDRKGVVFTFSNEEYAVEFAQKNGTMLIIPG